MLFLISFLCIALDQFTKYLAVEHLMNIDTIPIINRILHLTYVENTGAAFGFLKNNTIALGIFAAVVVIFMFVYYFLKKPKGFINISLGMLVGGAIGNIIDRFARGFVVDFIDFRIIQYPVFNIADICVVIGAVLLAINILVEDRRVREKENNFDDFYENTNGEIDETDNVIDDVHMDNVEVNVNNLDNNNEGKTSDGD